MKRLPLIALSLFGLNMCVTRPVTADVVSVSATADSTIDALQPAVAFPSGALRADKVGDPEGPPTALSFFYAQFNLPSGLTGQQMSAVNSAQFSFTRQGPDLSLTYHVYGVADGLDTASADTYTWNDGIGFDPTHNLVKFLTVDEISYYSDPAESSFVGTIDTGAAAGAGPFSFTSIAQSPTAAANLKSMILDDTDGRLTFYVGVRQNFGVTSLDTFGSLETPNFAAPALTIDFTAVPEPSSLGLAAIGLIAAATRRRTGK